MEGTGNKHLLNMYILNILREYSDENHALTQQDIIKLLEKDYDISCDRRTVGSRVKELMELGWDIDCGRGCKLLSREFDDSELRILIDSVLFSKSISTRQAQTLVRKLQGFASKYFNAKVSHVCNLPELNRTINRQAMYSLEIINDAIAAKKKIEFIYNEMGTDFKLHPKRQKPYKVNPYQIVANNGKFYLIGNYDKYDNVAHFRIDKMTDIKLLDETIKPRKEVPELANGLNLPIHMAEHIYMFSGASVITEIKTTSDMMGELVDWFGTDFKIDREEENYIIIRVKCNRNALRYWALQYGPYVEVLKPESLRQQIREDAENMVEKYRE